MPHIRAPLLTRPCDTQSLDGELLVIEQERIAFSKFLPNFLVPGPICYAPSPIDGFVTVNSQLEVEVFKYVALSTSSGGELAQESDKDKEGKKAKPDWTTTLGESALSVLVARHTKALHGQGSFDIVVLGEHTIFWLDRTGAVKQQKRLDFIPTCLHAYPVKDVEKHPSGSPILSPSSHYKTVIGIIIGIIIIIPRTPPALRTRSPFGR